MAQFVTDNKNDAVRISEICNFWVENGNKVFLATQVKTISIDVQEDTNLFDVEEILDYAERYNKTSKVMITWKFASEDVYQQRQERYEKMQQQFKSH